MTDAALGGRAFEPPPLGPRWLRPAVIATVIALHAAALQNTTIHFEVMSGQLGCSVKDSGRHNSASGSGHRLPLEILHCRVQPERQVKSKIHTEPPRHRENQT